MRLRVSEVCRAFQGEGRMTGVECVFIRLHGCPVACAWCDTAFTWDGSEPGRSVELAALMDEVEALAANPPVWAGAPGRFAPIRHAVVTGGEPLVSKGLPDLLGALKRAGFTVEVETAGVLPPPDLDVHLLGRPFDQLGVYWNVSPKLPSAAPKIKPDPELLRRWAKTSGVVFKLAVADEEDFKEAVRLHREVAEGGWLPDFYLMPVATDLATLADRQRWLCDRAVGSGFKLTSRMHVLAYGKERGR